MTVREWIRNNEVHGSVTFDVEKTIKHFPHLSEQVIRNELYRLNAQGIITTVYNGFYVVIPPQYAAKREVPHVYYIDQLMSYIGKPYYISLLNAAEILGSAHQRPQTFSVTTIFPKSTTSKEKSSAINWVYRKEIPEKFLLTKNSETGIIRYSNAEFTAIDIIQYSSHIGGLSRASTILSELTEITNFKDKIEDLLQFTTIATLQRLGYILDVILEEKEQAEIILKQLTALGKRLVYVPLSIQKDKSGEKNKKWKININTDIEVDDV